MGHVLAVALRWSVERAGIEFSLTSATLRKALNKNSAVPDADGCFSTAQVVAALYGSMHLEKLATQKELRRKLELENALTTGSVLVRSESSAFSLRSLTLSGRGSCARISIGTRRTTF